MSGFSRRGARGERRRDEEERPALPTEPAVFVHELGDDEKGHEFKTEANAVEWAMVAPSDGKRCLQPFPTVEIVEVKDGEETGATFASFYGSHTWTELMPDMSPGCGYGPSIRTTPQYGLAPGQQLNVYTGSGKHVLKGAKGFMAFSYGGGNSDEGFKFDEYKCEVCGRSGADLDEERKAFFIRPCCHDCNTWPCFECTMDGKAPLECKACGEESVSVTLYQFDGSNDNDDEDGSGSDDKEDDEDGSGSEDEEDGESDDDEDSSDEQKDTDQDMEAAETGTDDNLGTIVDHLAAQDLTSPDGEERPAPPLNSGLKQIHDLETAKVVIKQERDAAAEDRDDEADERRIAHTFIERQKDEMGRQKDALAEQRKTTEDQRKTIEEQSQRIRQLEDRVRELEAEQRGAPSTLRASPKKKTRSRR